MIVPFKQRSIDITQPVFLYRNLHLKGKWYSIKQFGKVVARVSSPFYLQNCEFLVCKSEHQRFLITRERNVHAFVKGIIADSCLNAFSWTLQYDITCGVFKAGNYQITSAKCVYLEGLTIKVQI